MNIDEARERLKEHDALRAFVTGVKLIAPDAAPATIQVSFEVAQALLHVAIWRCNELALAFDGQKTAPATVAPATTPGRPKVKPAVVEAFRETKDDSEAAWKKWAETAGFKWGSVANVLRELRAEREKARVAERHLGPMGPLNAAVDSAVKNFSDMHDNDLQKDASAELPSGVFHTK